MVDNKIVITYSDKDGRQTEKVYDTTNTSDVAELQALKESQKGKGAYIDEWNAYATTKQTPQGTTTTETQTNTIDYGKKYNY